MSLRSRWFLLLTGMLSATLVVAAACGGSDSKDKTPAGTTPGAGKTTAATSAAGGDQAPAADQKITIQLGEPQFLDPHRSSFEQDIAVIRLLFRGLYNLVDDGSGGVKVETGFAAGDPEIKGNVYTVKLKDGLKWSDGKALTAQDFVEGAKRGCDPTISTDYGYLWGPGYLDVVGCGEAQSNEDPAQKQSLLDKMAVRAVDDKTIEYTLTKPNGRFTTIMALWATFAARKDVIDAKGDAWTEPANIVTNGPFTLADYNAGESMVLKPNPNWTGKKPALQEIDVRFLDNLSAAFTSFQNDELQMTRINATDIVTVKADSKLKDALLINPTGRITTLQVQLKNDVLKNFDVRLALSQAIDRDALNDVVFNGTNTPAYYWVVKGIKGHQGSENFKPIIGFDPEKAKASLAKAGYPGGAGFPELSIVVHTPDYIRTAEFLQEQFKKTLGINIKIDQVESKVRSARFRDETFDMLIGGWQIDYPDIENPLFGLFETGGGNNHYSCADPTVDAALKEALAATSDDARIAAYQKMETAVVTRLCGVIPMWQDSLPFLINTKIGGVVANGTIDAGQPGMYCGECWYVKK